MNTTKSTDWLMMFFLGHIDEDAMIVNKIAEFIATNDKVNSFLDEMLAKDTVKEDGSPDFGNSLLANILGVYKNGMDIMEDGKLVHKFGWHVLADDESYVEFLKVFIPKLMNFLKE